jgi:hypothetical protein
MTEVRWQPSSPGGSEPPPKPERQRDDAAALRAALEKFGYHGPNCPAHAMRALLRRGRACDCGWDDARKLLLGHER